MNSFICRRQKQSANASNSMLALTQKWDSNGMKFSEIVHPGLSPPVYVVKGLSSY